MRFLIRFLSLFCVLAGYLCLLSCTKTLFYMRLFLQDITAFYGPESPLRSYFDTSTLHFGSARRNMDLIVYSPGGTIQWQDPAVYAVHPSRFLSARKNTLFP